MCVIPSIGEFNLLCLFGQGTMPKLEPCIMFSEKQSSIENTTYIDLW